MYEATQNIIICSCPTSKRTGKGEKKPLPFNASEKISELGLALFICFVNVPCVAFVVFNATLKSTHELSFTLLSPMQVCRIVKLPAILSRCFKSVNAFQLHCRYPLAAVMGYY